MLKIITRIGLVSFLGLALLSGCLKSPSVTSKDLLAPGTVQLNCTSATVVHITGGVSVTCVVMPTPTPSPTQVPTLPTATPTCNCLTPSPTPAPSSSASASPTFTPTPFATFTPVPTPTPCPTNTSCATPTPTPSPSPTRSPSPVPTPTPTATPPPGNFSFTSILSVLGNPIILQDSVCGGINVNTNSNTVFNGSVIVGNQVTVIGAVDFFQQHGSESCPHAFTSTVSVTGPTPPPTPSPSPSPTPSATPILTPSPVPSHTPPPSPTPTHTPSPIPTPTPTANLTTFTDTLEANGNPLILTDSTCGGITVNTNSNTTFSGSIIVGNQVTVVGTVDFFQQHGSVSCPHSFTSTISVTGSNATPSPTPSPSPSPTVSPTPGNGTPCYKNINNTQQWPANCLLYTANSPWNRALTNPDSPILFPGGDAMIALMVSNIQQVGLSGMYVDQGPSFPEPWVVQSNDPTINYSCQLYCGGTLLASGAAFQVPTSENVGSAGDRLTSFIQTNGDEIDCWETQPYQNPFKAGSCGYFPNVSTNIGWNPWTYGAINDTIQTNYGNNNGSASASGAALQESLIRPSELEVGQINHAIAIDVWCESGFIYPATHYDNPCPYNSGNPSANGIPAGARIWSDLTDAQVNSNSNLTGDDKTILIALHHYGAYIRDSDANPGQTKGNISLFLDGGGTSTDGSNNSWMYELGVSRWAQSAYQQAGEWSPVTISSSDIRYIFGDPWTPSVSGGILSHLHIVDVCYAAGTC
jgi:hypothetical protein